MNLVARFLDKFGNLIIAFPKIFAAFTIIIVIFLSSGIFQLNIQGAVGNIFNPKSKYVVDFENFLDEYHNLERDIIIVIEGADILSNTSRNQISNLHLELEFMDHVQSVVSIASLRDAPNKTNNWGQLIADGNFDKYKRQDILDKLYHHPIANHRLISKDGTKSVIIVGLKPASQHNWPLKKINQSIQELTKQEITKDKVYFTGFLAVSAEIVSAILTDQIYFIIGGAILGLILGYAFFRHFALVFATAIPALLAIFLSLGTMGWLGFSLNVMSNVVPTIMMVIAFADSMHMVDAMRTRLELGEKPKQAVLYALCYVGPACIFTTATTSIAFLSLTSADTPIVSEFGQAAAIGTLLALFSSLFISSLICIFLCKILPVKSIEKGLKNSSIVHQKMTQFSLFISYIAIKHAHKIVIFGLIILSAMTFIHFQNKPEYRYSENLPINSPASHAINIIDEYLGGTNSIYLVISQRNNQKLDFADPSLLKTINNLNQLIAQEPVFASHSSISQIATWLKGDDNIPPTIDQLISKLDDGLLPRFVGKNKKSLVITGFTANIGAAKLKPFLKQFRDKIKQVNSNKDQYKVNLTGLAVMSTEESHAMIGELNNGLLIAMAIIIVLMGLVFSSSFYAFASILPNLLPIVAGGALIYFIVGGLQFTTIIALTIAFGIAVDDSIHFLYQYRQNKHQMATEQAIEQTLRQVGPVLIATTFMLSAGLGLMFFSDLPQMSLFGIVVIFILNVALLADIAILPSIFYLKDKKKIASPSKANKNQKD